MEEEQQDAHQMLLTYPKHAYSCRRWESDYRQHHCLDRRFRKSFQLRCGDRGRRGTNNKGIVRFQGSVGTTPGESADPNDQSSYRCTRMRYYRRCRDTRRPARTLQRTRVIRSNASTAIPFLTILTSHREGGEKIAATAPTATANRRRGEACETPEWVRRGIRKVDSNRRAWRKSNEERRMGTIAGKRERLVDR